MWFCIWHFTSWRTQRRFTEHLDPYFTCLRDSESLVKWEAKKCKETWSFRIFDIASVHVSTSLIVHAATDSRIFLRGDDINTCVTKLPGVDCMTSDPWVSSRHDDAYKGPEEEGHPSWNDLWGQPSFVIMMAVWDCPPTTPNCTDHSCITCTKIPTGDFLTTPLHYCVSYVET